MNRLNSDQEKIPCDSEEKKPPTQLETNSQVPIQKIANYQLKKDNQVPSNVELPSLKNNHGSISEVPSTHGNNKHGKFVPDFVFEDLKATGMKDEMRSWKDSQTRDTNSDDTQKKPFKEQAGTKSALFNEKIQTKQ